MVGLNPKLKILNICPRFLARIGPGACEEIVSETADCMSVIVVECFLIDSLRSAKDGYLASRYEDAVHLEA